jgi:hypothetical protein
MPNSRVSTLALRQCALRSDDHFRDVLRRVAFRSERRRRCLRQCSTWRSGFVPRSSPEIVGRIERLALGEGFRLHPR